MPREEVSLSNMFIDATGQVQVPIQNQEVQSKQKEAKKHTETKEKRAKKKKRKKSKEDTHIPLFMRGTFTRLCTEIFTRFLTQILALLRLWRDERRSSDEPCILLCGDH